MKLFQRILHLALALFLLALPVVAVAQEASAAPVDASTVFDKLLMTLGSAALAAATWGLKLLTDWIATKIKNEKWAGVVTRLDDLALRLVRDIEATYVSEMEKAKADGVITAEEKAEAKRRVMTKLKSYLGPKGLGEIAALLGAENIDAFLGSTIESALANHQNAEALSSGPQ